mmetsp:Transcript_26773/g.4805  ORF Transcript_26773/g.4805 Transcript_26773/m.4805 type:complete len:82 (+) Transcript_26773:2379-2624(+)
MTDENTPKQLSDLENPGVPKLSCTINFDSTRFSLLCTELKHLYVAITRPRKRLIVFDTDTTSRTYMQNFWQYMGVVNILNI